VAAVSAEPADPVEDLPCSSSVSEGQLAGLVSSSDMMSEGFMSNESGWWPVRSGCSLLYEYSRGIPCG
jgi:hypothetical protein